MCELMRSLLARENFEQLDKIYLLSRIYAALGNDSPMRVYGHTIVPYRGYMYNQDGRKKLYKWIFKHYIGTNKSII